MENNPITDEQLAELDRLHEAAIKGMNWQEVAQFQAMITEQYQPIRQRLTDAESQKDNEELDGTDAAHPAWWRGNDAGVAQVCAKINAILDGADVFGTASEPWESTRRRVAEARKDLERLDKVRRVLAAYQGSALGCNPQILFAAVSDAARGTK